jgi:hypothetical protein
LLPVGALSAAALASRLLSRYGIGGAVAAASIAVDLAAETAGQVVFLICGIALVPIVNMSRQSEICLSILLLAVLVSLFPLVSEYRKAASYWARASSESLRSLPSLVRS